MYDYIFQPYYSKKHSYDYVLDKQKSISSYKGYMYNRLLKMFHYNNLPDTIPQYILEYSLMTNGSCIITEYNNNLFVFVGSFGGQPDVYYHPTKYIISNPGLNFNKELTIYTQEGIPTDECVICKNDKLLMGLDPLISRYSVLLAENIITLRTADIMLRVLSLITSPDDKSQIAAQQYLNNIENGKIGFIAENRFLEGIKLQSPPSNNGSYLTQFIELQQYLLGQFYNEIGLSASFNMKREAINEGEVSLNEDTLLPLIDSMLDCRKEFVSRLNSVYNLNIEVEYDSVWKQNEKEIELQLKALESVTQETNDETSKETNDETSKETNDETSKETNDETEIESNNETENEHNDENSIKSNDEYNSNKNDNEVSQLTPNINITIINDSENIDTSNNANEESENDEMQ